VRQTFWHKSHYFTLPFWQIYGESTAVSSTNDKKFTAKTSNKQRRKPPKTATTNGIKQEKHIIIMFFDTFSLQFQTNIVTLHLMGRG